MNMGWHPHHHPPLPEVKKTTRRMSSREIFARLIEYLRPYKKWIVAVTIAVIVTSITGIASPYILGREIIAKYILRGNLQGLQWIILVFIGIQVANWIANTIRTYGMGKIGQSLLLRMRSDLFSHLQELSFSFYDESDSGDLISRVTNDTDAIGEAFTSGLIQVVSDILNLLMIVIVMFSINVQLSLVSMIVVPLMIIAAALFNSKFRAAYQMQRTKI